MKKTILLFVSMIVGVVNLSAQSDSLNGHEAVDLGLSVKWASCNVGAVTPEQYGEHYAWGEIRPKATYTPENSATMGRSLGNISGIAAYDAARANWGGTWRMPTSAEINELLNKCTWTFTTQGGYNGYKVTGPNGNSIFLPAAGYCDESSLDNAGSGGGYWSSTPHKSYTTASSVLYFDSGEHFRNDTDRYYGRSVRSVTK